MITLNIAMPFNDELEEECKFLNVDDGSAPQSVIRYAAMQGVSLAHHKLTRAKYDWGTMHFTFEPVGESEFVTLPTIPYTDENYDPLHGPAQHWWVAICRAGVEGPNILDPKVVEEVKAACGGLDLTGKEVNYVTKGMHGYHIRIRRDLLNAPVLLGVDMASEPDTTVEAVVEKDNVRALEDKQLKYTEKGYRKLPETKGDQSIVGKALDSVLDALTIGSILD
jgi:hypothetical protein